EGTRCIGEGDLRITRVVGREPEDAFIGTEALNEIEVGFAVLNAGEARGLATTRGPRHLIETDRGKDLLDDVTHAHVEERPVVTAIPEQGHRVLENDRVPRSAAIQVGRFDFGDHEGEAPVTPSDDTALAN